MNRDKTTNGALEKSAARDFGLVRWQPWTATFRKEDVPDNVPEVRSGSAVASLTAFVCATRPSEPFLGVIELLQ